MNQADVDLNLHMIRQLQQRLLPQPLPRFSGWELSVHEEPGEIAGGDYYDVLALDPDHLAILIADVSGHGPAAATLMAMIRMLLHACPLTSGQGREPFCPVDQDCLAAPHIVLQHLNQVLLENSLEDQFVTMVYGILGLSSGIMRFSVAGHMPPCWWQAARGTLASLPDIAGLPLGADAEATYESATVHLEPDDQFIFYTDGITEARDRAGAMFGDARLFASIRAHAQESAQELNLNLIGCLNEYLDGASYSDDVTLLILKRLVQRHPVASENFVG